MDQPERYLLSNDTASFSDLDLAELVSFARPPALLASFQINFFQGGISFGGCCQLGLVTVLLPRPTWCWPGKVVLDVCKGPGYPRIRCGNLTEAALAITAHELWHVLANQSWGFLGQPLPEPAMTPERFLATEWDYTPMQSVEERWADRWALNRLRAWRRRSLPTM